MNVIDKARAENPMAPDDEHARRVSVAVERAREDRERRIQQEADRLWTLYRADTGGVSAATGDPLPEHLGDCYQPVQRAWGAVAAMVVRERDELRLELDTASALAAVRLLTIEALVSPLGAESTDGLLDVIGAAHASGDVATIDLVTRIAKIAIERLRQVATLREELARLLRVEGELRNARDTIRRRTDYRGDTACPSCGSPNPHMHPVAQMLPPLQFDGEVFACPDAFHRQDTP